jgi:hypothetical protein
LATELATLFTETLDGKVIMLVIGTLMISLVSKGIGTFEGLVDGVIVEFNVGFTVGFVVGLTGG